MKLLLSITAMLVFPTLCQGELLETKQIVIEAAGPETPRADTASMTILKDGRIMIVYQKYEQKEDAGRDRGYCRIWSKISEDDGLTWADPRMLIDAAPGDINVMNPMLLRLESGDLLLACHRNHPPHQSAVTEGLYRSQDDGQTFVEETPIWKRPPSYRVAIPPFNQLESGRIVLAFAGMRGPRSENFAVWCMLSDDDGNAWTESEGTITLPRRGAMEPSVVELADGRLVMAIRTQLGGPYVSRSTDRGETWSEATFTGLEGGESGTCLRRLPGSDDLLLLFNNSEYIPEGHHHYGERTPLTAAVSRDSGETWHIVGDLGDDPEAEYTNLNCLFTRSGTAIVTYMFAKPSFNRERIDLRAAILDLSLFTDAK